MQIHPYDPLTQRRKNLELTFRQRKVEAGDDRVSAPGQRLGFPEYVALADPRLDNVIGNVHGVHVDREPVVRDG